MGKIQEMITRLKAFTPERQEADILKIVKAKEDVIVNMNTDQLFSGLRSDGKQMPNYSPVSVNVYGKPDGPIRLFDRGDFYNGFFVDAGKWPVRVDSRDSKTVMLVEGNRFKAGYGEDIFGLLEENKESLRHDHLKEEIREYYKRTVFDLR